jgi:hypothetical protein
MATLAMGEIDAEMPFSARRVHKGELVLTTDPLLRLQHKM